MTEIELKAHVDNKDNVIEKLNSFASFTSSVTRDDTYYKGQNKSLPSIRFRKQTENNSITNLITYKRKELRQGNDGVEIEVNNEMECTISDTKPLITFLEDAGFEISLQKHKEVMDWSYKINDNQSATLELCLVPPLGYFLEIEILSDKDDEDTVKQCHDQLIKLLLLSGLSEKDIEPRYYSELLKEYTEKS